MIIDGVMTLVTTLLQPIFAVVGGATSTVGSVMGSVLGFFPYYDQFNRALPLAEMATCGTAFLTIKAASLTFQTLDKSLGYIPFVGIGKK